MAAIQLPVYPTSHSDGDELAYSLLLAAERVVQHGDLEYWVEGDDVFQFRGDETQLRYLLALARARQVTDTDLEFEDALV